MNIIFEYEEKRLILPVNPETVKVTIPSPSQKTEVIGIGEISIPQEPKLATININSFFWEDLFNQNFLLSSLGSVSGYLPHSLRTSIENQAQQGINKVSGVIKSLPLQSIVQGALGIMDDSQKFKVLNEYVKWFRDWKASQKPARWTIIVPPNEPPQCFDFYVTCENFEYEIKAGEEGDYYYSIELLEWRDYGAKVLKSQQKEDGTTVFENEPPERNQTKEKIPSEQLASKKDSIWSISKKYCQENWKDLVKDTLNISKMSVNPQDISGMIVKIPNKYL